MGHKTDIVLIMIGAFLSQYVVSLLAVWLSAAFIIFMIHDVWNMAALFWPSVITHFVCCIAYLLNTSPENPDDN